jgi:pimeloyl-ACP methyl ester carboxylesterase
VASVASVASVAPVVWEPCEGLGDEVECATLPVPLDHTRPNGETIPLALIRWPAKVPAERTGAIVFNPGGPGGSGVETLHDWADELGSEFPDLRDRFDMVSFDPRGVGRSAPLVCVDGPWLDAHVFADLTPDDPTEQQVLDDAATGVQQGCWDRYGDRLRFFSTEATARDMDLVRQALGDETISYYGMSYGTVLGAVYASLFPTRVRSFVLDAGWWPWEDAETSTARWAAASTATLGRFIDVCQADPSCAFGAPDVEARLTALQAALDTQPLTAPDGRTVNATTLATAFGALGDDPYSRNALAAALRRTEEGDPARLLELADMVNGRAADGTYPDDVAAGEVIWCASGFPNGPLSDTDLADLGPGRHPVFGPYGCDPIPTGPQPASLAYTGAGPIVVIGGRNDTGTPYDHSVQLVEQLGPKAVLTTYTGQGHTAFFASYCARTMAAKVFRSTRPPAADPVCAQDNA